MAIEIDDGTMAMWYFDLNNPLITRKGNYLAELKRLGEQKYRFTYRFRYYKDDLIKSTLSKDEFKWYQAEFEGPSEEETIQKMREVVTLAAAVMGSGVVEIVEKGMENFWARFRKLPMFHVESQGLNEIGSA